VTVPLQSKALHPPEHPNSRSPRSFRSRFYSLQCWECQTWQELRNCTRHIPSIVTHQLRVWKVNDSGRAFYSLGHGQDETSRRLRTNMIRSPGCRVSNLPGFRLSSENLNRQGLRCAFRPPRGSKCSPHFVFFSVIGSHNREPTFISPAYQALSLLSDNDRGVWSP
jgi:hypothetical protein